MEACIFCKIIKGEIDSAKVWEDENFTAILDVNPNTRGMTLILSKKHYDSYVFDMSTDVFVKFMVAAKNVARMLENGLQVKRIAMVMEGMGVNHADLKLYPLHGLAEKFAVMVPEERIFFDVYHGYISTLLGPSVTMVALKKLAEEIKKKNL